MKRWRKTFYQRQDGINNGMSYACQREAIAIYEEIGNPKNGLYVAKLVEIQSNEDFRNMSVAGGDRFQHVIGEIVKLRQHKKHSFFINPPWFNVEHRSSYDGESFYEIIN